MEQGIRARKEKQMTPQEKATLVKEKKQLQAFIGCLRTENDALGAKLSKMIPLIGNIRESQLGIDLILRKLAAKLKK